MTNFHPATYAERWALDAPQWSELENLGDVVQVGDLPEGADFAEKLVRRFFRLCEHRLTQKRLLALIKSIIEGDDSGLRLIRLVNLVTGRPVLRDGETASTAVLRWQLVGMILAGSAMGRYIRPVEPIASAPEDQVVAILAPSIRAALAR